MKKIEVKTGQFYRVKIKNRDIYMGYWDIADDWSIEGEGETPEKAIMNALENASDCEILEVEVDGVSWDLVDFILFENKRYEFLAEENECLDILSKQEVAEVIKNSKARAEAKERKVIKEKREEKERAEKKEVEERAEWERLNEKFKKEEA